MQRNTRIAILVFVIAIGLLLVGIILYWPTEEKPFPEFPEPEPELAEDIIQKQLKELEGLRADTPPLTEKEIQSQLRELEKLRLEVKPLTEEEIQRQLEELEKLRQR